MSIREYVLSELHLAIIRFRSELKEHKAQVALFEHEGDHIVRQLRERIREHRVAQGALFIRRTDDALRYKVEIVSSKSTKPTEISATGELQKLIEKTEDASRWTLGAADPNAKYFVFVVATEKVHIPIPETFWRHFTEKARQSQPTPA